ncbi:hypothetical protein D3C85_1594520 [compost metagenome]
MQLLNHILHIPPESKLIRLRMCRIVNAAVDATAHMLNEATINTGIDLGYRIIPVENCFSFVYNQNVSLPISVCREVPFTF